MYAAILVLQLTIFLCLAILFILIFHNAKREKAGQNKLLDQFRSEINDSGWRRIYIARPIYFKKINKLLGYEGRGILINHPEHIKIVSNLRDGTRMEISYPKNAISLEWLGSHGFTSTNLHWIKLGQGGDCVMISADTGFNAFRSREETADICRLIDRGFVFPTSAVQEFRLESNKASLLIVVLFFVLIGFAIFDGVIVNKFRLIDKAMMYWLVPSMLIPAIPCYHFLSINRVPWRESYTLSLLLFIALSVACIPIVKRLDQFLPGSSTAMYEYKSLGSSKFEPIVSGPPPIKLPHALEYWEQFEEGSNHSFELVHGPLGLWQLNETELYKKYRKFFRKHNEENQ